MVWIVTAVARWTVLAGLYLVLAGQASRAEIVAAALAGAAGAALSLILRAVAERQFDLRLDWLRALAGIAWSLVRDTVRVQGALAAALFEPRAGAVMRRPRDQPRGGAARAGRRAVEILAQSVAPNEYVIEDEPQALCLHRLAAPRREPRRSGNA